MVVAKLRQRLVMSRWLEQRQEVSHYGVDRAECVPNVKVDRIEQVPSPPIPAALVGRHP